MSRKWLPSPPVTLFPDFSNNFFFFVCSLGYSRIPVYDGNRSSIVSLLYIKDLAFVDPDDNTPLRTLCEFYQNGCFFIFEDMTLDVLFKKFKEGRFGFDERTATF